MRYISIREIFDNLTDNPILKAHLTFERCINYTQRFIKRIGMINAYEEKTAIVNIKDWRGLLPCDLFKIIQVRVAPNETNNRTIVYKYSTDSFHMSNYKQDDNRNLTYKIQGDVIFTSSKEIPIEISYLAIKTDEEGYPLIPDNGTFATALEYYIKCQVYDILNDEDKISDKALQKAQQEYCWAVGAAQAELVRPSIDEMESFSNMWNQLLTRTTEHDTGFKNLGRKEYWRTH